MKNRGFWRQVAASVAVFIGNIEISASLCFSAVLELPLRSPDSDVHLTEEQFTWLASLLLIGSTVACFFGGHLADQYGRKTALVIKTLPGLIGWSMLGLARSVEVMLVGRFITGICIGLQDVELIYTAEISEPKHRGTLFVLAPLFFNFGGVLCFSLGMVLEWRWQTPVYVCICVVELVAILLVPETPTWLVTKGRHDDARKALLWLRDDNYDVDQDLMQLIINNENNTELNLTWKEKAKYFTSKGIRKPFVISVLLLFFQAFSGGYVISFYAINIFKMSKVSMNEYLSAVVLSAVRLLAIFLMGGLLQCLGRKTLLILSSVSVSVFVSLLGAYSYVDEHYSEWETLQHLRVLPLFCLIMMLFSYALGMGPIVWLVVSEIFPAQTRGVCNGVSICIGDILLFLAVKLFYTMNNSLHLYGTAWFYAVCAILSAIFVAAFVPETKDKSLEDIENEILISNTIK